MGATSGHRPLRVFQVRVKVSATATVPIKAADREEAWERAMHLAIVEAIGRLAQSYVYLISGNSIEILSVEED